MRERVLGSFGPVRRVHVLLTALVILGTFWRGDARAETSPGSVRVGLARVCITPEKPLWLHGYASPPRFRPFEGKLNDLLAKAMAVEDARGERAVLITVDLCVLRPAEAKALFDRLMEKTGLARRQLLVNLSHTHSGPMIGASDFSRVPMPEEDRQATLAYTERLYDQLAEIAAAALADLQPARLSWGAGKCGFVRNRRLYREDGSYRGMGPNASKYVDDTVPVLRVDTPEGKLRAIVFGCACHPVTLCPDSLKLSGDYAGFAQEEIESRHAGVQAMFVQGCGADANSEPRCGPDQAKNARLQGNTLADEVCRVASGPLQPVGGPLQVKFCEVDLPLKPAPSSKELAKMTGSMAHNAKRMLAAIEHGEPLPRHHTHPLALWHFGEELTLVGLSGEVVSGYVPLLQKALGPDRLWIAGYSNEVDGYLPDATIVAEGGYEARGLVADIGFYSADAEGILVRTVRELRDAPDPRGASGKTGGERDPSAAAISRAVQQEIDAGLFPGAVVLVGRPGEVLYHEAFGHAQVVPEKVAMRKDHIFELASVTKVVATGTAFGVCVDDGLLRFDMPIAQALPELSGKQIDRITVDHLATHTSGFDNAKYHGRAQGEAMLELMLGASPQWETGSRYHYSCLNVILLGRMVERASGQRLDAFCDTRIFRPLGMRDTRFGPLSPSARVVPSGAPEIGQIEDEQARMAGRPVGNAGLFSTAADLARFCQMMLGGGQLDGVRILSGETHGRMTRNHLQPPLPARGFCWEMDPKALHRPGRLSERAYGHSGHTGQSIWIDPEKQVYVIVLTNRNHPKMVGGERKTQQYRARARIGDAALDALGY